MVEVWGKWRFSRDGVVGRRSWRSRAGERDSGGGHELVNGCRCEINAVRMKDPVNKGDWGVEVGNAGGRYGTLKQTMMSKNSKYAAKNREIAHPFLLQRYEKGEQKVIRVKASYQGGQQTRSKGREGPTFGWNMLAHRC